MNLTYSLRLVCIAFASFFLVQAIFNAVVGFAARGSIRTAGKLAPRFAALFLFALRMAPLLLAAFVVFGLCVPSYLLLEPPGTGEQVGWPCVALALLGAATCIGSATRVILAEGRSRKYQKACGKAGRPFLLGRDSVHATIISNNGPLLAVAGVLRSNLIVSSNVLQALSADELNAALLHERAHQIWRDNFKQLLFVAASRGFAFSIGLRAIERQWARFSEWAADDFAAGGDPRIALSLAAALVRIARLGSAAPLSAITSSFVQSGDLSGRVERLLRAAPSPQKLSPRMRAVIGGSALGFCSLLAGAILWPASLSAVHYLLERLID